MSIFPQSTLRPRRLRDYGAFQTDISTLDTLAITAIQRQDGRKNHFHLSLSIMIPSRRLRVFPHWLLLLGNL